MMSVASQKKFFGNDSFLASGWDAPQIEGVEGARIFLGDFCLKAVPSGG